VSLRVAPAPPAVEVADVADIWAALAEVPDPEVPAVSVVDLGIVHRIDVSADAARVEILPTFVGCPAVDAMRSAIEDRLAGLAPRVEVSTTFAVPWTSDRISPEGRRKLAASGFAPPTSGQAPISLARAATCPYCGSRRTVMENAFGPTLCRSIYYCTDCRQPFEQFKTV
jgi:ring-1,2-phenylacetyl-CoA epoxidase subunit PaaD